MPGLGTRRALQQEHVGQLEGAFQRRDREDIRGAHRHHLLAEQFDALGARPGALTEEEHHVGPRLQQVKGFQLIADIQVNTRVGGAKTLEVRDQPARAKGWLGGDLEHLGLATVGEDVAGRHLHLLENLVDLGEVQRAGWSQLQAPADAAEQQMLEHLLQLRDLLAHRALGQEQLLGGAGEAEMPGHGLETLQGGHRRHQAFGHGVLAKAHWGT